MGEFTPKDFFPSDEWKKDFEKLNDVTLESSPKDTHRDRAGLEIGYDNTVGQAWAIRGTGEPDQAENLLAQKGLRSDMGMTDGK